MEHRRAPLAHRVRYWFDTTLARGVTALIGWLAAACLAVVVPVSAALVWTDGGAPASLLGKLGAVWRHTGETLRLGGTVGPPLRVLLSVLLALVALFYVSTLVGLVTAALQQRLAALRLGRSTVLESGHAVVLGWSEQVYTVVSELVAANANQRRAAVAVLADRDKTQMEEALRTHVGATGRTRLVCRSGPTTDPVVLARMSPGTATAILVLPREEPSGDAEVVKTLLALEAAGAAGGGGPSGACVVAAVRDARHRLAASLAAGPRGRVLETDDITARLVVQSARQPGLWLVHRELLDFAGDEFYTVAEPALTGRTFGDAVRAYRTSCAVGLLRDGGALVLNPPAHTVVTARDRLLVIAHDDDTAVPDDRPPPADEALILPGPPSADRPERILLLGWNRRAALMADLLGRYVPPGSVLDVVADGGGATADAVRRAATAAGPGLSVTFRPGDTTCPATVRGLDAPSYDSVIVLASGADPDQGYGGPDDRTLTTLLLLREAERASGRELSVVTEMTDDRNRVLAPVRAGADCIVSGKLIGLLMAQISQNPHLADVFRELFSPEGQEVHLRPAGAYVRPGSETAFATAVESALRRGECAIGYREHTRSAVGPDYGIRINPDKTRVRRWSADDRIIVIAQS
ncbi:NAD-binding lipoprotein [Streptomyces desertarenae]|uniref:NAD-binding lipoprotein n=1 Tax=Streptomyces desertarenae TaxID=2666184 RepID=A0ABW4PS89_9ACTN